MKLKPITVALLTLSIIFLGYLTLNNLSFFQSEDSLPERYEDGSYDASSIKGSYTFEEISRFYDIPLNVLAQAFMIENHPTLDTVKTGDLSALFEGYIGENEIGNGSVQLFVAAYLGQDIELIEDTYLFESAVRIIIEENQVSDTLLSYIHDHTLSDVTIDLSQEALELALEAHELEEKSTFMIKGNTTFSEVLSNGITEEELEEILGHVPNKILTVKDYCEKNDLTFSTIKKELEALLAQ